MPAAMKTAWQAPLDTLSVVYFAGPHGATTPFRGEKMSTYEGGVRVISMLRWPGVIAPGQVLNGIQCHQDMFTSLAALLPGQPWDG
jgi:arylsulfatase A-like enzyme